MFNDITYVTRLSIRHTHNHSLTLVSFPLNPPWRDFVREPVTLYPAPWTLSTLLLPCHTGWMPPYTLKHMIGHMTKPTKWHVCPAKTQINLGIRERTAKTLIRLGGCPGWSDSPLGAQSFCWFCHEEAYTGFGDFRRITLIFLSLSLFSHGNASYKVCFINHPTHVTYIPWIQFWMMVLSYFTFLSGLRALCFAFW